MPQASSTHSNLNSNPSASASSSSFSNHHHQQQQQQPASLDSNPINHSQSATELYTVNKSRIPRSVNHLFPFQLQSLTLLSLHFSVLINVPSVIVPSIDSSIRLVTFVLTQAKNLITVVIQVVIRNSLDPMNSLDMLVFTLIPPNARKSNLFKLLKFFNL